MRRRLFGHINTLGYTGYWLGWADRYINNRYYAVPITLDQYTEISGGNYDMVHNILPEISTDGYMYITEVDVYYLRDIINPNVKLGDQIIFWVTGGGCA